MSIIKNNLKRLIRDKSNFLSIIILPVVFIAIYIFASSGSSLMRVGVVDNDDTSLTRQLRQGLEKSCMVVTLKEDEIKEKLINDKVEYAVNIHAGFTQDLISGKDVSIKGYGIKNYNAFIPAKLYINSFVNSAKNIAKASNGDKESFEKGMRYFLDGMVTVSYKNIQGTSPRTGKTMQSLAFVVMFMMYLAIDSACLITEDKKLKTYERILTSPLSLKKYMAENALSFLIILLLQVVMLFSIMRLLFKMDFGPSIISMVIFTFIYSAAAMSLGMAIINLSKTFKQVASITSLIVVPMSMLGGCFWPRWIMPDMLQNLGNFVPITWALQGMEKILAGGNLLAVIQEIIILLLFSLVFSLVGSAKKSSFS